MTYALPSSFFSSCFPSTRSCPDCTDTFSSSGLYSEALIFTSILVSSSSTLVSSWLNVLLNSLNVFWLLLGIIHPSSQPFLKKASLKGLLMLNGEKVLVFSAIFLFRFSFGLFAEHFSLSNSHVLCV